MNNCINLENLQFQLLSVLSLAFIYLNPQSGRHRYPGAPLDQ